MVFIDICVALSNVMVAATEAVRKEFKKCEENNLCSNIEEYKEGVGFSIVTLTSSNVHRNFLRGGGTGMFFVQRLFLFQSGGI